MALGLLGSALIPAVFYRLRPRLHLPLRGKWLARGLWLSIGALFFWILCLLAEVA